MKPRAAGRNQGTPIPHFATLMRATSATAQCRGPGGTARGRNHDESHRDRDAALRRGLAQLQLRQACDRRRHRRLERIRRGLWLARRHGGDRAARRARGRPGRLRARAHLLELYCVTRPAAGGVVAEAMGAIENALLDAKAKRLGVPCYELLGGKQRDRIRLYWSHCATWRINHPDWYKPA